MKKFKLLKCERETVINFNDADKVASISTTQEWMKRRLKKLAEKHPDDVAITYEDDYVLFAEVPKRWCANAIRPPRFVSEEQRKAASERLKKYRESQKGAIDEDDTDEIDEDIDEIDEDIFEEDETDEDYQDESEETEEDVE